MLTNKTINNYISSIPALPQVVKKCSQALEDGDMLRAADIASEDRALVGYLRDIVNKPIFGFRDEIKDIRQVFGILGIKRAKQLLYGYYILLILPKKWEVFDFNSAKFQEFQARIIFNWDKIVKFLESDKDDIAVAISIIPASFVICEMLFRDINSTVKILRDTKGLSYETILHKMTDRTFFDLSSVIAKKWDFSDEIVELIARLGDSSEGNIELSYLRLLLAYEMSRAQMVQSGLSELFEISLDFDEEVVRDFYELMQN